MYNMSYSTKVHNYIVRAYRVVIIVTNLVPLQPPSPTRARPQVY